MTAVQFPAQSFAAIVSFYALIHLPLDEHRPMLERCFAWLQPGGVLLATVGHSAWTGTEEAWHGAPSSGAMPMKKRTCAVQFIRL